MFPFVCLPLVLCPGHAGREMNICYNHETGTCIISLSQVACHPIQINHRTLPIMNRIWLNVSPHCSRWKSHMTFIKACFTTFYLFCSQGRHWEPSSALLYNSCILYMFYFCSPRSWVPVHHVTHQINYWAPDEKKQLDLSPCSDASASSNQSFELIIYQDCEMLSQSNVLLCTGDSASSF